MAGVQIEFVQTTEHVGILRSVEGNLPHLLRRFASHNRALHSVLAAGLARGHRGNPAASLRVEQLYGLPVLLSGTAALVLKKSEEGFLDSHYKRKLESLMKLHQATPEAVVFFLAGALPATARLHLKQLSLFSMITRLPNNILHRIAMHRLTTAKDTSTSWFIRIRDLCLRYGLPHPISQLRNPMSKLSAKSLFKSKVIDYHEIMLRESASSLSSLYYFKPNFMSLTKPHPLWTSCCENSYEVSKAIIEAKLISGRYRTDRLARHFQGSSNGDCRMCDEAVPGTIEHLLLQCPSLEPTRSKMFKSVTERHDFSALTKTIICDVFSSPVLTDKVQLLLDCSCLPVVISSRQFGDQTQSELFKFARTWCFSVHAHREKLLKAQDKQVNTPNS